MCGSYNIKVPILLSALGRGLIYCKCRPPLPLSTLRPSLPGLWHLPCVLPTTKPGTPGFAQPVPPNEERFSGVCV